MSKITVYISERDDKRRYAAEQLLGMILGVEYEFIGGEGKEVVLECEGKRLSIAKEDIISVEVGDIVKIYGDDILMATFFMLSREEEIGGGEEKLDEHGRFKAESSLACKEGFLDRPVVNEYAEWVVERFALMGVDLECKRQGGKVIYTHDIDILTNEPILKSMGGDILKRHDILSAISRIRNIWYDEHDTFEYLMELSEKRGQKGTFNIMGTHYDYKQPREKNYLEKKAFARMIEKLEKRGHRIGFHPGYYTSDDEGQWKKEREKVEKRIGKRLTVGRQHYLRVFVPRTLEIWEDNEMETDSSLGYADKTGFRCGTGCAYHPYDFRTGKSMKLIEQPLIVMDETMKKYEKLTEEQKKERIMMYESLSEKYNMPITLLYHN